MAWINIRPVDSVGVVTGVSWELYDQDDMQEPIRSGTGLCQYDDGLDIVKPYIIQYSDSVHRPISATVWSNTNPWVITEVELPRRAVYEDTVSFETPVAEVSVWTSEGTKVNTWTNTASISFQFVSLYDYYRIQWTTVDGATVEKLFTAGVDRVVESMTGGFTVKKMGIVFSCDEPDYDIEIYDQFSGDLVLRDHCDTWEYYFIQDDYEECSYDFKITKPGYYTEENQVDLLESSSMWNDKYQVSFRKIPVHYVDITVTDASTSTPIEDFSWTLFYDGPMYNGVDDELKYSYSDDIPAPDWIIEKDGYQSISGNTGGAFSMQKASNTKNITVNIINYDTGGKVIGGEYKFKSGSSILKEGTNTTGTLTYSFEDGTLPGNQITYLYRPVGAASYDTYTTTVGTDTIETIYIGKEKHIEVHFKGEDTDTLAVHYLIYKGDTLVKESDGTTAYYQYEGATDEFTVFASHQGYRTKGEQVSVRYAADKGYNIISLDKEYIPTIDMDATKSVVKSGGTTQINCILTHFEDINPTFTAPSWISNISYAGGKVTFDVAENSGTPRSGYLVITNEGKSAQCLISQAGVTAKYKLTLNITAGGSPFTAGSYTLSTNNGRTIAQGNNTTGTVVYEFNDTSNIPENKITYKFTYNSFIATDTLVVGTNTVENIVVPDNYYLAFQVLSAVDDSPIAGATVVIQETGKGVLGSISTDSNGKAYYASGIKADQSYTVTVIAEGYQQYVYNYYANSTSEAVRYSKVRMLPNGTIVPEITANPSRVSAPVGGMSTISTIQFKNFTDLNSQQVASPNWIRATLVDNQLSIYVNPNYGERRTGSISVIAYNGIDQYSTQIQVTQEGKIGTILAVGGELDVTASDTSSHQFTVTSTDQITGFSKSSPSASWLHIIGASLDSGVYTVHYYCDPNNSQYARSANLTVSQGSESAIVTIYQSAGSVKSELMLDTDSATRSAKQQQVKIQVTASGGAIGKQLNISTPDWIRVDGIQWNDSIATINTTIDQNTGDTRTGLISINYDTASVIFRLTQVEEGATQAASPIWKEKSITMSSSRDFIEYHIEDSSSNIIYAAKAYKYPDSTWVKWSINEPISNYLSNSISFDEGVQDMLDYIRPFTVTTTEGSAGNYYFYNSWAYKDIPIGGLLSDPIDTRLDPRQFLLVSWLNLGNNYLYCVGTREPVGPIDGSTYVRNLKNYIYGCDTKIVAYTTNDPNYKKTYTFSSGDYVLYYTNAYGGWDSLLLLASSKKTDDIESFNYRKKNGNTKYLNRITPTWNLKTNYWIDGEKMYHLLESTNVYLHNLESGEIVPVVITDTQCEYKNQNNERKPYYYEINVEEANYKYRK